MTFHRLSQSKVTLFFQVNNSRREMVRKDLGDSIMEVYHNKGTDRWLVIKKELDASNVSTYWCRVLCCCCFLFILSTHSVALYVIVQHTSLCYS